ncbi:uncharacterized protein V6R79_013949 [Siganus canaliculatus]
MTGEAPKNFLGHQTHRTETFTKSNKQSTVSKFSKPAALDTEELSTEGHEEVGGRAQMHIQERAMTLRHKTTTTPEICEEMQEAAHEYSQDIFLLLSDS